MNHWSWTTLTLIGGMLIATPAHHLTADNEVASEEDLIARGGHGGGHHGGHHGHHHSHHHSHHNHHHHGHHHHHGYHHHHGWHHDWGHHGWGYHHGWGDGWGWGGAWAGLGLGAAAAYPGYYYDPSYYYYGQTTAPESAYPYEDIAPQYQYEYYINSEPSGNTPSTELQSVTPTLKPHPTTSSGQQVQPGGPMIPANH